MALLTPENLLLVGLTLSAFALRWYFTRYHTVMVPDYDGAEYISLARKVFSGGRFYTIFIPPGLPIIISLALRFFDDLQTAGMFVSALFGSGLCVAVYLFAASLFDKKTALLAAAFTAFFGQLVVSSTWVMSEMPFGFFLFMALFAGLKLADRPGVPTAAAYGGLFGFAYLIRPEAMVIAAMATAVLALFAWHSRAYPMKRLAVGLLLAACVFAAFCAPYIAFLESELGRFSISGKVYYNLATGEGGVNAAHASGPFRYLLESFGPLAEKYAGNLLLLKAGLVEWYHPALLLLAGIGAAVSPFRGPRRPLGLFYPAVLALFVLALPFFFIDMRIISPYYPVLLIYAALAGTILEERLFGLKALRPAARYRPLSVVLALALLAYSFFGIESVFNRPDQRFLRSVLESRYLRTGSWLKGYADKGDKAYSRELLPVFYSGLGYVNLPDLPPERLWRAAKDARVRFVIVDDVCINKRQQLGPLLVPLTDRVYLVPGFSCVYNNSPAGIIVYEVEDRF